MKVELRNVTKTYGVKEKEKVILDKISYQFQRGKFYAIVGESGVGKTTLLDILSLQDCNYDGNIIFNEILLSKMNEIEIDRLRNKDIGIIFQDFLLMKNLNVNENLMLPMLINEDRSYEDKETNINELLKQFGLGVKKKEYPDQLSIGQQQRVAIARALVNNPSVIFADEPTSNLDAKNAMTVQNYLKNLSGNGKTIVCVTHDENLASVADVVLELKDGHLYEVE